MATTTDFDGWLDDIGLDDTVSWNIVDALYYAIKHGGGSGKFEVKPDGGRKCVYALGAPKVLRIVSSEAEAVFLETLRRRIGAQDQTIDCWIQFQQAIDFIQEKLLALKSSGDSVSISNHGSPREGCLLAAQRRSFFSLPSASPSTSCTDGIRHHQQTAK